MGDQNVAFLPSQTSFPPHFLQLWQRFFSTLGLPQMCKLWLGVGKGMLHKIITCLPHKGRCTTHNLEYASIASNITEGMIGILGCRVGCGI